ncbi:MAG: GSCFA domain-containing protein [Bacteroidales bacterium]|nr:GSCFA domain-containing protein [Bacteroidales bacterium]
MDAFRTIINEPESSEKIDYLSPVMMTGSCFAENIGHCMQRLKFNIVLNPFGVAFHPLPLARQIDRMIAAEDYRPEELHFHNDLWGSFDHHGRFSHPELTACLNGINAELHRGHRQLTVARRLFVTFGTAWAYRLKENGKIVANCHHYPSDAFERFRASTDEIHEKWTETVNRLRQLNPDMRIVFSVSPIRHLRDGAHQNQLSKATLLLAIEQLNRSLPHTAYFPAYEIMTDDLRDYRFYEEDMTHPNPSAVKYIWQYFCRAYFSENTISTMKKVEDIVKASEHKPVRQNAATKSFAADCLSKIKEMQQQFPLMDFSQEIALFDSYCGKTQQSSIL